MRSPVREKPQTLLGGEIRSGPGSKVMGAPTRLFPLIKGWRTIGPDPSISPPCSAPSTLTRA